MAHFILIGALVVGVIVGPQWWAQYVIRRYGVQLETLPGTGGELARHLLEIRGIRDVTVELTPTGDHYDPISKTVRLSEKVLEGKSLTAVAVAAHEVGHAIQDHEGYAPLKARSAMVGAIEMAEKLGAVAMMALPIVALLTRSPVTGALMLTIGLASLGFGVIVHLVTLPVEWNASFGRAAPMLRDGGYIDEQEERAVNEILRACALTYVAGSLASLLNVWRWIAILRK